MTRLPLSSGVLVLLALESACFTPQDSETGGASTTGGSSSGDSSGGSATTPATDDTGPPSTSDGPLDSSSSGETGVETSVTTTQADTTAADVTTDTSTGADPAAYTVFLNFEGPTLAGGAADDARIDQTSITDLDIDFQPYGDAVEQATVLSLVEADFAAFDVLVTDERPDAGDYTMIVVSPTNPFGGGVLAISSGIDCGNANLDNIGFAFFGTGSEFELQLQANAISSQVGLSVGLERTIDNSQADVMHQFATDDDREFLDLCIELRETPPATCIADHEAICGAGSNRQNAFQELEVIFGPA